MEVNSSCAFRYNINAMTDDRRDATAFWYRTSSKNVMVFALIFLGEPLLILMFIKWAFHMSATWYLVMIPWAIFGLMMVIRPYWFVRIERAMKERFKQDMARFGQWMPPGFP
jgi:hypothetical protein